MTQPINSRWNGWRTNTELVPQTYYEACVFLDNAILHLRNRSDGAISRAAFAILNGAHNAINEMDWELQA